MTWPSPFASALIASFLWSISPLLERSVLQTASPMHCLFIRTAGTVLGGLVLLPFLSDWPAAWAGIRWSGAAKLVVAGCVASVAGQVFMYRALKAADASLVSPIAGSWPLLVLVFGWLFLQEPLTVRKAAGCLLIVSGVWLLRF